MRPSAISAMAVVLLAGSSARATASDTMTVVNAFLNGFNNADAKTMVATCASPAFVLDDFAPHTWSGPTACADWWNAFKAFTKSQGFTDNAVTIGKALHDDVTGDRAYVVVPATYTYKAHGRRVTEGGAKWTLVLKKTVAGWRIAAWAWAD